MSWVQTKKLKIYIQKIEHARYRQKCFFIYICIMDKVYDISSLYKGYKRTRISSWLLNLSIECGVNVRNQLFLLFTVNIIYVLLFKFFCIYKLLCFTFVSCHQTFLFFSSREYLYFKVPFFPSVLFHHQIGVKFCTVLYFYDDM